VSTPGGAGARTNEPITVGIPFPRGWCAKAAELSLTTEDGEPVPLQVRQLEHWSDGSLRWALLDFCATTQNGRHVYHIERSATPGGPRSGITVEVDGVGAVVDTGAARFALSADGALVARQPGSAAPIAATFRLVDSAGVPMPIRDVRLECDEAGPLRSSVLVQGVVTNQGTAMPLFMRYHFYAGLTAVRVQATLRNPSRAAHPGGFWELGDAGSRYVKDFSFQISQPAGALPGQASCSVDPAAPLAPMALPLELYQDSSGGENWQSPNHLNRNRVVPTRFRGYRMRSGVDEHHGLRATPIVAVRYGTTDIAVAHPFFWQRFPKAVEATDGDLVLRLLPSQSTDVNEIQGGEQISEEFVVAFGRDTVAEIPLEWVRDPLLVRAEPEWYCAAQALPHLTPLGPDEHPDYRAIVAAAIEGDNTFESKRERIDEYGWRHFGDLYGDHENAHNSGSAPLISHYNNQYDAVAGFLCHFFRSGDERWRSLATDLARHVVDIDIYHTTEDKAAYNNGLFWHTSHYVDADLSTHRTYARRSSGGSGGPSAEHNYSTGLMLHYFLTGDTRSRDAAVGLAEWVIAMDDGARNVLRWLSRARTGFASATGSALYHGPGRGPGNSIVALMNACRLTGEEKYLRKAEELIRRCVHPEDDLPGLNLLDTERRWYYTVFLQALGSYLDFKAERGELDAPYVYAQAALLHYARWMAEREYPYLDKPDILEFPNETWVAQDMRKSEVFTYACKHAREAERARFLERADFFFDYSVSTLRQTKKYALTRPLVLMLTNGFAHAYFKRVPDLAAPPGVARPDFGRPTRFRPQRQIAKERLVAAGAVAAVGAAAFLLRLIY